MAIANYYFFSHFKFLFSLFYLLSNYRPSHGPHLDAILGATRWSEVKCSKKRNHEFRADDESVDDDDVTTFRRV